VALRESVAEHKISVGGISVVGGRCWERTTKQWGKENNRGTQTGGLLGTIKPTLLWKKNEAGKLSNTGRAAMGGEESNPRKKVPTRKKTYNGKGWHGPSTDMRVRPHGRILATEQPPTKGGQQKKEKNKDFVRIGPGD